jgi:hypothetical protein
MVQTLRQLRVTKNPPTGAECGNTSDSGAKCVAYEHVDTTDFSYFWLQIPTFRYQ